jgi:hypothetical protein
MSAFDVHAPLLSLPGLLKTSLASIPATVPYLSIDVELVHHWRRELNALPGFKIGIVWQGHPGNQGDQQRSVPLAQFEPLAQLPNVRVISLQKGPGSEQVTEQSGRFPVLDLGDKLDAASGPFMDTAAILMSLDLVIGVDTATAHLAGALAVPMWLLLPFAPDWRWMLQREDSPWYPTMRLFRQREWGDWQGVFDRLVPEVRKWADKKQLLA